MPAHNSQTGGATIASTTGLHGNCRSVFRDGDLAILNLLIGNHSTVAQ